MSFDPSKPFTVASDDAHQGASGFDPTKPFSVADQGQSAMTEYQKGNPNAQFKPDLSKPEAYGRMVRSGATGGMGEMMQGKMEEFVAQMPKQFGGQQEIGPNGQPTFSQSYKEQYNPQAQQKQLQEEQAKTEDAKYQYPGLAPQAYATGLAIQAIAGAEPTLAEGADMAGQAFKAGKQGLIDMEMATRKYIADAAGSVGQKIGKAALKAGSAFARWTGTPGADKVLTFIGDQVSQADAKTIKANLGYTDEAVKAVGKDLAKDYTAITPSVPAEVKQTKTQIWQGIEDAYRAQLVNDKIIKAPDEVLTGKYAKELTARKNLFNEHVTSAPDAPIEADQLWNFRKQIDQSSGEYRKKYFSPAAGSKADRLSGLSDDLNKVLFGYTDAATSVDPEAASSLIDNARKYGHFSEVAKQTAEKYKSLVQPQEQAKNYAEGMNDVMAFLGKGETVVGHDYYSKLMTALQKGGTKGMKQVYLQMLNNEPEFKQRFKAVMNLSATTKSQ